MRNNTSKIGILAPISHSFPPNGYGPWELVAYNLAEALVELGEDVTVFATKEARTKAKLEYIIDTHLEGRTDINHRAAADIHIAYALKRSQELGIDILHNHLNIHPVLLSTISDVTMVTTLHAAARETENSLYYDYLRSQNFVSLSLAERQFRPDLNYVGNVFNGVDFNNYSLKKEGKYLLFSGRVEREKGILSAIQISKKTGLPLKIAGIVTNKSFFEEQVKPHIDNQHIEFLGNLSYPELTRALESTIALIAMVEWNDTCPLSVIDALASGVPVIGSTLGALPEMVDRPELGVIVKNVDDAVAQLGSVAKIDPQTCQNLARAKFSREVMAKKYLEIYKAISTQS